MPGSSGWSALDRGRGPCGQRLAPGADAGRASEEPEVLKLLEHVEVAKYRSEHSIHHRETLSGKVRPRAQFYLDLFELSPDIRGLGRERLLVGRAVKPTDGVQYCRTELHPEASIECLPSRGRLSDCYFLPAC